MSKFFLSLFILGISTSIYGQRNKNDTTVIVTDDFSNSVTKHSSYKTFTITVDTNYNPVNLKYDKTAGLATDFFGNGNYLKATELYEKAIAENKGLGKIKDRFKLACCYAKLGNNDSAFVNLFRIVKSSKYYDIRGLETEVLLKSLHKDERWKQVIIIVEENLNKLNEDTNNRLKKGSL